MRTLTGQVSAESLSRFTDAIREAYNRLGYTRGWGFCTRRPPLWSAQAGSYLVGINPGGDHSGEAESVESGNAYLVEQWSPDGTRLQRQVRAFFRLLAEQFLGDASRGDRLLNQTLTTNFCPFRSPTWRQLPRQSEAVAFSELLHDLSTIWPRVILSMGALLYRYLQGALASRAREVGGEHQLPTGWGSQKFAYRAYERDGRRLVLARFPHLSDKQADVTADVRATPPGIR